MHGKKYDDAKKEIRSVLLTYKDSVTLEEFLRTYRNLLGQRLPSRDLGFPTDVAFLQSMPDVVDLKTDSSGKVYLNGIADKASQHIQKLVSKQKQTRPGSNKRDQFGSRTRQPLRKLSNILPRPSELKPFLPGELRAEILELMNEYNSGVALSAFALSYHKKFKKFFNLARGLDTLEALIKLIPELEIRNEGTSRIIYNRNCLKQAENEKGSYRKNELSTQLAIGMNAVQKKSSDIHESGIPNDIIQNFQMILQKCPDGIQNIHFPPLYEHMTGKEFDFGELGYNSMADLVEVLPHIFTRVPNPGDLQHWLIYPTESHIAQSFKAENITLSSPPTNHLHQYREGIPADVSTPSLQYIKSTIPDYINLNEYIPIFVSAIDNPSKFWFQLQTDELIEKFEKLEKDMKIFYSNASDKYKMNSADIAIGATCVIQFPDDYQWYRAVIKSIPSTEQIHVSFVDYGSSDNVPRNNLYYVWSKFHEYPVYSFKAQLADLKPAKNANSWSSKARVKFVQLCNCPTLMAYIKQIDKDSYSICLCDTSGDSDIYLHDILINEGYAEYCHQSHFDVKNSDSSDPERISNDHNISEDSESCLCMSQDVSPSDDSDAFSETSKLPGNMKTISTNVENNVVSPNVSHFNKDKTSKRYVKQVEICEGSKIHLISLENKLFMSCGELCSILWSEKNAHFLIRRLMHKEIDIPFLHIKKEDYVELFQQCLWYKVPGFEKNDSDNSPVILCPIEQAFNVLNIFGHPSVCLRIIIQHEIRIFDPHEDFWNEFLYEEQINLNDTENGILREINKLCLYDLKMKSEAFEIQRLKLLRLHSNPPREELRKIDRIQNAITRRMKQIEAICSQYSTCS